jgi:RimK family alpha-L-glutamate ligase
MKRNAGGRLRATAEQPAIMNATLVRRFALVASGLTQTNQRLLEAARALGWDSGLLDPAARRSWLTDGDVALGRLDVLPTLDGPEPGLEALRSLEEKGVIVLNRAGALLGAHDKLVTAFRLGAHGLPHPRTAHVGGDADPGFDFPVVVKPRFGSWGRHVRLCRSPSALRRCLRRLAREGWFRHQGALVQELIPLHGSDLRILVAAGEVVGAIERRAGPGEWRTNVELGGERRPVVPPPEASLLALTAAQAIGADLVGVDLLPDRDGSWTILELNGAVDFTAEYALDGTDVFQRVVATLGRAACAESEQIPDGRLEESIVSVGGR